MVGHMSLAPKVWEVKIKESINLGELIGDVTRVYFSEDNHSAARKYVERMSEQIKEQTEDWGTYTWFVEDPVLVDFDDTLCDNVDQPWEPYDAD